MSYSIIYGQQFIKLNNKGTNVYLPIVLIGDNNVYEHSGARARDFNNLVNYTKGKQFATAEEILANVDEVETKLIERNNKEIADFNLGITKYEPTVYDTKSFGWFDSVAMYGKHTSKTSFAMFRNVFVNGIKNALTVEQLKEVGVTVNIKTSFYSLDNLRKFGKEGFSEYVNTSDELLEMIEAKSDYLAGTNERFYISFYGADEVLQRIKMRFGKTTERKPKERKPVNQYYVIRFNNGYYFNKLTARKLHFALNEETCKKFKTHVAAQVMAGKLNGRFSVKVESVDTIEVDTPIYI